jgi:hypothetical protein
MKERNQFITVLIMFTILLIAAVVALIILHHDKIA